MAAVTIWSDCGAQEKKVCYCLHCFPIYFPWSDGTSCHELVLWMLNFKPALSLSSLTCIWGVIFSSSCDILLYSYLRFHIIYLMSHGFITLSYREELYTFIVKKSAFRLTGIWLVSWFCHLLDVWLWTNFSFPM